MLKLTVKTAYIALVFSIVFEQISTACLEACDAYTKPIPVVFLIISYVISYFLSSKVLKLINLSISYSTWTALGTISAALIGLFAFHQTISLVGWLGIGMMCAGVFLLNLFGTPKTDDANAAAAEGSAVK